MRSTKVEDFMPRGWPLACQEVHLVVAVQVVLVAAVAELHAFE